ncbi:hypothetical protein TNCV_1071071 [Trichonephila clavipes]|nr:hypothetical protein TNCV_1071071 [Trichonephila clavipes]
MGNRPRGKPSIRWIDCIEEDLDILKVKNWKTVAQSREAWRRPGLDLELEMNEDDIEELIMGHEDELTTEELQEILNEEHQETQ